MQTYYPNLSCYVIATNLRKNSGTCSQCRSLNPGLQMICNSGMWTLNLSTLLLTLSATRLGPGASLNVLVSFSTVLYMPPISSSTSSAFMSVNGPLKQKQNKNINVIALYKVLFVYPETKPRRILTANQRTPLYHKEPMRTRSKYKLKSATKC